MDDNVQSTSSTSIQDAQQAQAAPTNPGAAPISLNTVPSIYSKTPSLELMKNIANKWNTGYITNKNEWLDIFRKHMGIDYRVWFRNFVFFKITFDEKGNMIKTRVGVFRDLSHLMSESDTKPFDVLLFVLNHVCDLKVLNDLRRET